MDRKILTNERTVVCASHFQELQELFQWVALCQLSDPDIDCWCCEGERQCPGPAFCNDAECGYCSSL